MLRRAVHTAVGLPLLLAPGNAAVQSNLGNTLSTLGIQNSETGRLEEAVKAFPRRCRNAPASVCRGRGRILDTAWNYARILQSGGNRRISASIIIEVRTLD